ncbi:MAG: APC family permease [Anaerolineales bacterium]
MFNRLKELLIGSPLPTQRMFEEKLNKVRALAAFSPDALSSIAYANQEIYLALLIAGSAGLSMAWPIGLVIVVVLSIAAVSYYQTIHAYPSGGGSYIVARSNFGTLPGLIAAAALLIDYILTAAVSLTAGVDAFASAFPFIWPYRVIVALVLLALITLINMRGLRETGTIMSIPVYLFLFTYLPMLAYGGFVLWRDGPGELTSVAPIAAQPVTIFLLLHAFATGCTALTGIEAISNGVPAFKPPESDNAGKTLIIMAFLMGALFLGSIGLTQSLAVVASPQETILSALASRILGHNSLYFIIQISTMLVLTVAANTSFADFPRVAALLAKDGFLPRQFKGLGDRLVFANGILILSSATALLIILFQGDTHLLVPLFAVGAFLAFTLSQSGMVLHWWREKGKHWQLKALANGVGALATGVTLLVVGITKFLDGAWVTIFVIPLLVIMFLRIRKHYQHTSDQLTMHGMPPSLRPFSQLRVVVPISGVHRGVVDAVRYALTISNDVTGVYVELNPGDALEVQEKWNIFWPDIPLVTVPSPYRSVLQPLLDFLDKTDTEHNDGQQATVVLPEFVPAHWWQSVLHNQTAWLLKAALLYHRRNLRYQRVIIDVPYYLHD